MRFYLLLSVALASVAFSSPLPDREPVEFTPRPSKTKTCDCSKVSECPEKRNIRDEKAIIVDRRACLTRHVVDSIIDDISLLLALSDEEEADINSTAKSLLTENFKLFSGSIKFMINQRVSHGIISSNGG
jgi:hypothetical protein